jgi:hypothetical protein
MTKRIGQMSDAGLDAALKEAGQASWDDPDTVRSELARLNRILRSRADSENLLDRPAPRQNAAGRTRPQAFRVVGLAAAAFAVVLGSTVFFDSSRVNSPTSSGSDTPTVHSPAWMPLPSGISRTVVDAAGARIYEDHAAVPMSGAASTPTSQGSEAGRDITYQVIGVCLWAQAWLGAQSNVGDVQSVEAAAVLSDARGWPWLASPGVADTVKALSASVQDNAPAEVVISADQLGCGTVDEELSR